MKIWFWKRESRFKKYLPYGILLIFALLIFFSNIKNPLSFVNIKNRHSELMHLLQLHPVMFPVVLFGIYVISICLVIPDSTLISVLAGSLFPFPLAVLFISFTEAIGAFAFYYIIRFAFKDYFRRKEAALLHRFEKGFSEHEISYLLFLRFSHILPFWLINVIAVLFKTKPLTFLWTTFVGTLPLAFILAQAGRSLQKDLLNNTRFSLESIFNMETDLSLLALGVIALLPIIFKKFLKLKK